MNHSLIVRRVIVAPFMENVYIVGDIDAKECMVIDPGAEAEKVLKELNHIGLVAKLVVNTHGHMDHTGAVAAVQKATGAPYALHPKDRDTLKLSAQLGANLIPGWIDPPDPVRSLSETEDIKVGDLTFKVLETPGHTPGGVCLYGPGVLFTGDTLFRGSIGRFDLPGGDGEKLIASIGQKLVPLPPDTVVYPGHGPESTIGIERATNPFLQPGKELGE